MRRLGLLLVVAAMTAACGGGDNGGDGGDSGTHTDARADTRTDSGGDARDVVTADTVDSGGSDSGATDSGTTDSGATDSGTTDTDSGTTDTDSGTTDMDSGTTDTDAGSTDTDSGTTDTDSGTTDTDSGTTDTDSGTTDTDSGTTDAGSTDTDSGTTDAGGGCLPTSEVCNGLDDDCDGVTDNGFDCAPGTTRACTTGCGSTGVQTCNATCSYPAACTPPTETCNGADDNCDGATDEGFDCIAGATAPCTTVCGSTGTQTCTATCGAGVCQPPAEVCNGVDDDCDGAIDEIVGCEVHLLISEIVNQPTPAEFIEIYNPTANAVDLSQYYLSDYDQYFKTAVTGMPVVGSSDFVVKFPAGAMIQPGEYITVAMQPQGTTAAFPSYYNGACPTYYIKPGTGVSTCTLSQQMEMVPGGASATGWDPTLTNGTEPVTLFRWDGTSDLVTDVDYVDYGTPSSSNPQVNKTGQLVDGPDTGATPTPYAPDTLPAAQQKAPNHVAAGAIERCDYTESTERATGGNGVMGHDETSEPLASTFFATTPAMQPAGSSGTVVVNGTPNAASICQP